MTDSSDILDLLVRITADPEAGEARAALEAIVGAWIERHRRRTELLPSARTDVAN